MAPHRRALSTALVCSLAVASCDDAADPRPQWLVTLSTDAPVPQFGDLLLVEVLDEDHQVCGSCSRLFAVREPAQWPVSFGIVPAEDKAPVRIRARLYRSLATGLDGLPADASLIDATGRLPALDGLMEVSLELRMDCFGVPPELGQERSCDATTGQLAPEPVLPNTPPLDQLPKAGSWPPSRRTPCAQAPPEDMVCVEGGVFLLGGYHFVPTPTELLYEPLPERLVQLSAFAIDRDEVTVETVRGLDREGRLTQQPTLGEPGSAVQCTYLGIDRDDHDGLPINCVSQDLAREVCAQLGKRLPTEAEWEFAAVNGPAETIYPWGDDGNGCAYALVGSGRAGERFEHSGCIDALGGEPGLRPGGLDSDQTQVGIRNLGGSLTEWVEDDYLPYDDPCWSAAQPLVDPLCTAGLDGRRSIRGGAWSYNPAFTQAVRRNGTAHYYTAIVSIGFRCAR